MVCLAREERPGLKVVFINCNEQIPVTPLLKISRTTELICCVQSFTAQTALGESGESERESSQNHSLAEKEGKSDPLFPFSLKCLHFFPL